MTSTEPPTSADRDTPRWLVFYCGCLMTISAFSTDAMLPAVHAIALDLDVPITWSQATIPAFIAPFAFGQLFFGPASDQFGRRPLIALGMTVFLAGSLLATLGTTIEFVLTGRGLQGFGAAAGPVLARAILRDCYSGTALARSMSTAMAIFSIGPILAPFIGYGIQSMGHWRLIFAALAGFAAGLLLVNIFVFRESLQKRREGALRPSRIWSAIQTIIGNRQSLYFIVVACSAYWALMIFIVHAPVVYANGFGIDGFEFAALFASCGLGIILGQIGNRLLLPRLGIIGACRLAAFIIFAVSAMSLTLAYLGELTAIQFTILMFFFNTSFLVIVSNSLSLIIDPHPEIAGLVSAFFGFITAASSSLFVLATFGPIGGDIVHWGVAMSVTTFACLIGFMMAKSERLTIKASDS